MAPLSRIHVGVCRRSQDLLDGATFLNCSCAPWSLSSVLQQGLTSLSLCVCVFLSALVYKGLACIARVEALLLRGRSCPFCCSTRVALPFFFSFFQLPRNSGTIFFFFFPFSIEQVALLSGTIVSAGCFVSAPFVDWARSFLCLRNRLLLSVSASIFSFLCSVKLSSLSIFDCAWKI